MFRKPRTMNRRLRSGDPQYQRRRGFVVGIVLGAAVTTLLAIVVACSALDKSPYATEADALMVLDAKFTYQLQQYIDNPALRDDPLAGRSLLSLSHARDDVSRKLADALNNRTPEAPPDNDAADNTPEP